MFHFAKKLNEEGTALLYLFDTFRCDDDGYVSSYSLEEVLSEINRAPPDVKRFLKRRCRTVKHLEECLDSYSDEDYFWVENRRMTLHYPFVEDGRDKALSYFEDILDTYEIRPCWKNLYGHIGKIRFFLFSV